MLALDRSARRIDQDGHLHVERANICKACVSPYFGREIPDYQRLGLDANSVYMLYRDPEEIRKGAQSAAGKPMLMHHKPVHASDEKTIQTLGIGAIGTDVQFQHPYLSAPLSVWRADAIKRIDSEEQRQLSPGYRYRADMTAGTSPEGVAFDGSMRDILFNHLAIVFEGRQGPDVVVPDAQPRSFSTMKRFLAALASAFPGLTAEQSLAMDQALAEDLKEKVKVACVEDEFPDMGEDARKAALDSFCKSSGKAMDALKDDDKRAAYKAAKDGNPKPFGGMDEAAFTAKAREGYVKADGLVTKIAHDEALAAAVKAEKDARDAAVKTAVDSTHALYAARNAVADKVGATALDSAEATYRFALDHVKVEHKDVPASALAALYSASAKTTPAIAVDAKPFNISDLFPSLPRRG